MMNSTYESYAQWRSMMTETAGLNLDPSYCRERIEALSDEKDPSTKSFVKTYGVSHRNQIVRWFQQVIEES
ncbi:MAG: hypothetical protein AAGA96_19110 [Verrucomicrobiota bacterium]